MLFERQKRLLALLDVLEGTADKRVFQKFLLLFCTGYEDVPTYEFVPYRNGAFSFTSYADFRRLAEQGLVVEEDHAWKLTPGGREAARVAPSTRNNMQKLALEYRNLRGEALIAETYRKLPFYAINSSLVDRLLKGEEQALQRIENARPKSAGPGLCTIGYEGRTLENYLNVLIRDCVTLLCDVRRNPLSRKYGFSKKTLSHACEQVGIRYEHIPQLGIASEERQSLNTQADYDALFRTYKAESLPKQGEALSKILQWIEDGQRVALTCFEHLPCQCHRNCVAEALLKATKNPIPLSHL